MGEEMRFLYLLGMLGAAWMSFEGLEEKSRWLLVLGIVCYTLNTYFFVRAFKKEVPE